MFFFKMNYILLNIISLQFKHSKGVQLLRMYQASCDPFRDQFGNLHYLLDFRTGGLVTRN